MAKQLNVNLAFTADTAQAKAQIKDLNNTLDTLMKGSATTQLPLTKEIQQAQSAAATLKVALNQAFNEKTGKLDLTQFSDSLKKADLDAAKLRQTFEAFGPAGSQAFMNLAKSVAAAELPLKRTNGLMSELWTTMKNTARWQLSSTVLHGFMGTVQNALYYAQDLDKSLNNIRIVTGYSAGEMASFAEQANKAAKALSTTTTKYTDASLIYFQQGLDKEQVAEMADITVRMANVTGQSSQVVSDQLTAIWNNFNKSGEESYEKYADVLTALGAATASSTDEIAGGLEKFASIADMIGLSYEYAASALATITATTRQSEDVVGTALKTIFARIQGLSLGETLDDGTDLNKYSQALEKVGISIFDQNNQLKDMDLIVDEIGNKWSTLSKDQQVALAQTVAGVRQYNQLVSLFDNWDYFGENLNVAMTAEGELDKQAEIYAESWQAARDRVKAAAEDIYDSILDDKAFIFMLNSFEKLLSVIGTFIDSIGGLPGAIGLVGIALTKAFSPQLTASLDNIVYKFNNITGANVKNSKAIKESFFAEAEKISYDDGTNAGAATADAMSNQINLQKQILNASANLSAEDERRLNTLLEINGAYAEQAILQGQLLDESKQSVQDQTKDLRNKARRSGVSKEEFDEAYSAMAQEIDTGRSAKKGIKDLISKTDIENFDSVRDSVESIKDAMKSINTKGGYLEDFSKIADDFELGEISAKDFQKALEDIDLDEIMADAEFNGAEYFTSMNDEMQKATRQADDLAHSFSGMRDQSDVFDGATANAESFSQSLEEVISSAQEAGANLSGNLVKIAQGTSQAVIGVTSLVSAFQALGNSDMSIGEKVLAVTMSLSVAIPSLIAGISALVTVKWAEVAADAAKLAGTLKLLPALFAEETAVGRLIFAKAGLIASYLAETTRTQMSITQKWLYVAATWAQTHALAAFLAVLALVAIAVAAATFAIRKYQEAQKADAAAAEEASTAAINLANAYQEAKSSYEDMMSAMSNYKDARDGLDSLTKGTQEYNEALKEANRQALELIQNYPQFFSPDDYKWEDGELILSDTAMRNAQLEQQKEVDRTYAASAMGQVNANEAQTKADVTALAQEMARNYGPSIGTTGVIDKVIEMQAVDPGLLTNKEYMAEKLEIEGGSLLAQALWDNRDTLIQLSNEVSANTAAREVSTQEIAREALNSYESPVKTSLYKDEVINASAKSYDLAYNKKYDTLMNQFNSGLLSTQQSEYARDYVQATGLDQKKGYQGYMDKDGTLKYSYIDEQTGERTEEKEVAASEVASVLATTEALNNLNSIATNLAGTFQFLETVGGEAGKGIKSFLTGEGMSKGSTEALQQQVNEKGSEETLGQLMGLGSQISDEEAARWGYDSATAMISAFEETLNNSNIAWDNMSFLDEFEKYTQTAVGLDNNGKEIFATDKAIPQTEEQITALRNISAETAQQIENTYNKIKLGPLGEQGGQDYIKGLMSAIEGMSAEDATKALEQMAKIDWSDPERGMDQLKKIASDLGYEIDTTSSAFENFDNTMQNSGIAATADALRSLVDNFIALKNILGDEGLTAGAELSLEEYEKLLSFDPSLASDFLFTGSGYEYIGEQLDMENFGLEKQMALLNERNELYQQYLDKVADSPKVQNMDFDDLVSNGTKRELNNAFDELFASDATAPILESLGIVQENLDGLDASQLRSVMAEVQEFLNMGAEGVYESQMYEMNAAAADTLTDLQQMYADGLVNAEAYEKGVRRLAGAVGQDLAQAYLEMAAAGEEGCEYMKDSEELATQAAIKHLEYNEAICELIDNAEDYAKVMENVADSNTKAGKAATKNEQGFKDLKKTMTKLFNATEDFVDDDTFMEFLKSVDSKDFQKALQGNEEAIDNMRNAWHQTVADMHNKKVDVDLQISDEEVQSFNEMMAGLEDGAVVDIDTNPMLRKLAEAATSADNFEAALQSSLGNLGIDCDVVGFYDSLAEAEAAAAACGGQVVKDLSFEQEIDATQEDVEEPQTNMAFTEQITSRPITRWNEVLEEGATETARIPSRVWAFTKTVSPNPVTENGSKTLTGIAASTTSEGGASSGKKHAVIKANKSKGTGASPSTGNKGGSPGGGSPGGGSGGSSTPAKRPTRTHKREIWDPFRDTTKALERIADALEDVEKRIDRLYGKNRVDAIKKVNKELQNQLTKLREQKGIAEYELKDDMRWLNQIAKENGLGDNAFTFKEEAQWAVSNYSKIMQPLWDELHGYQDEIQKMYENGATEEEIQAYKDRDDVKYDDLEARVSNIQAALGIYDESVEKLREIENAIDDAFYQWQDNNYEILNYELEIRIIPEEMDLKFIEYMTDKLSDDFYSMSESITYLLGSVEKYENMLGANEDYFNNINEAYKAGEISQQQYIEGIQTAYDNILDTLSSLNQLDKDMLDYYAEALSAFSDEMAHYTDQLEHYTSVLDHYYNLVTMIKGEFAFEKIGQILEGKRTTLKNELNAATAEYEALKKQKEAAEKALAQAPQHPGYDENGVFQKDPERELLERNLKAAEEALAESHENMLSKTEEWAENELAIYENTMAEAAYIMEMALTDNMGFDSLSNSIDRLNSHAEVYLTKTNQIYEMQTLVNKAQTEIDKTTNKAAQQRINNFIKETEALKEKNKLSNLELEIQQAKYELLLAEIALEEAQNAKATVRLKRDSEGNFGYVYTADQEAIGEAEQEVLDAQNRLYNIGLEGANEYGEKLLQLRQEWADAMIELEERRAAGEFATDELYNAEKERINREYYDLMEAYSEQYTVALGVDAAIQEEAWVNAYQSMITTGGEWQSEMDKYTTAVDEAYRIYHKNVVEESEIIKAALDEDTDAIKAVEDASNSLANELQSNLPLMEKQLDLIRKQTEEYAKQRQAIQELITKYEELALKMAQQVRDQSTMESTNDIKDFSLEMSKWVAEGKSMDEEYFKDMMNKRAEKLRKSGKDDVWIANDPLLKLLEAYDTNEKAKQYVDDVIAGKHFYNEADVKNLLGLATGGYTGAWGPDGRIALLHEKELVLNASDTSNFLKAIDIMREITKSIDLENLRQQYAFAINSIPTIGQRFAETIEQNVHIEASFPAVSDRNEIEEAFNNLINTASQFANRKRI